MTIDTDSTDTDSTDTEGGDTDSAVLAGSTDALGDLTYAEALEELEDLLAVWKAWWFPG